MSNVNNLNGVPNFGHGLEVLAAEKVEELANSPEEKVSIDKDESPLENKRNAKSKKFSKVQ